MPSTHTQCPGNAHITVQQFLVQYPVVTVTSREALVTESDGVCYMATYRVCKFCPNWCYCCFISIRLSTISKFTTEILLLTVPRRMAADLEYKLLPWQPGYVARVSEEQPQRMVCQVGCHLGYGREGGILVGRVKKSSLGFRKPNLRFPMVPE